MSHYDMLYSLEKKEIIIFDKSKIYKVKKISVRFLLKMMKNKIIVMNFLQINKKIILANWFPQNSSSFLLKDVYYQRIFDYLSKPKDKFSLRLFADLDISKKKIANWLWAIKKKIFEKKFENEWN